MSKIEPNVDSLSGRGLLSIVRSDTGMSAARVNQEQVSAAAQGPKIFCYLSRLAGIYW
jgi:hypothetical protein